jgi:hypothetical protein
MLSRSISNNTWFSYETKLYCKIIFSLGGLIGSSDHGDPPNCLLKVHNFFAIFEEDFVPFSAASK